MRLRYVMSRDASKDRSQRPPGEPKKRKKGVVPPAETRAVMTVRELAWYLDCHPTTIYRLLRLHEVPAFRLGGDWRFWRDTIDEWIEELTNAGPPKRQSDRDRAQGSHRRHKKRHEP